MSVYKFTLRERKKNSNEPVTYDITGPRPDQAAGTLTRRKQKWRLQWLGTGTDFASKHEVRRHLTLLGHAVEGLV